jgi:hypothetical protein
MELLIRAQLALAKRRKASTGNVSLWLFWATLWFPLYTLSAWVLDLACLRYRNAETC